MRRTVTLTQCAIALGVMSRAAMAQVDITGGSPAAIPNLEGAPRIAAAAQMLVLDIVVNGTSLGEPSSFDLRDGQLYAKPDTLDNAGIITSDLKPDADGWIALSSIPGLRATYQSARQEAVLVVEDSRLTTRQIGYRLPPTPKPTPGTGFVLNYDISYARQFGNASDNQLGIWSEQRFFTPYGVLDNTGTWLDSTSSGVTTGSSPSRYTRLDTNYTYSNPAQLFTLTVGDAVSGSLPWTRSVRFGGVQFQRDFSLRPDLVTFPLPTFSGSAAVPSAVDLYINGLRQYSGQVAPGPFQIAQAPSLNGAGVAQVIVTDALGRRVATSVPLYIATTLLAKGLLNYSAEVGFLRDDYTVHSFSYESSPVYSGTASYGVSDRLTVQGHTEGGQGLNNVGAGAVVGLGNAGVFSMAGAASRLDGLTGALFGLGYQYISQRFSLSLQGTRASDEYRDVASLTGISTFKHLYQATVSVSPFRAQSVSLSYIDSRDSFTGSAHVLTLAYNAQFGKRWSLFATAYRDFAQRNVWGGSIGVTVAFGGNVALSNTISESGGHTTADVTASRPADFSGGWGWTVQGGAGADYRHAFAGANYRSNVGEFQTTVSRFNGTTTGTVEATGALAFMDGALLPSRTITDGFALVSTDGVAGVPVRQENRPVGTTNGSGHLLVTDLTSYQRNQLSIDPLALPPDARIDNTKIDIAPERRSGALARFGMSRYQGASVSFVDADGKPVAAGAAATNATTGETAIVGYDGVAFFQRLDAKNRVRITGHKFVCNADVSFDAPQAGTLAQIGPVPCQPDKTKESP
jgi:outer membrane usher protein